MPDQFGSKLRRLRLERDLTQTDLARQLNLARPAYVSNLEAGRRMPSLDLLVQIAELLEVTIEYLLRDDSPVEEKYYYKEPRSDQHNRVREDLFGDKLYHLRKSAKMTQAELAHELALSAHVHISKIESGHKAPSIELLLKIADLFDVMTDYLLRDTIPITLPASPSTIAERLEEVDNYSTSPASDPATEDQPVKSDTLPVTPPQTRRPAHT